ncbi:MAG: RNA methyltransferase [Balneolaceae bacterium]
MSEEVSARQIARWRTLSRRKGREREGLFLIEGERAVRQVISNGRLKVESVLQEEGTDLSIPGTERVVRLDRETFRSISCAETPQGIMAVATIPAEAEVERVRHSRGILLALDAIQDPGNLGTLLRTALWFGVEGVLIGKGTVDVWNPKVVRSTAGATGALPWISGELETLIEELETAGWETALLDIGENSKDLSTFSTSPRQILVVGNEGNGIRENLRQPHRPLVRIDGDSDRVESLNVAIAGGIALYSLSR